MNGPFHKAGNSLMKIHTTHNAAAQVLHGKKNIVVLLHCISLFTEF